MKIEFIIDCEQKHTAHILSEIDSQLLQPRSGELYAEFNSAIVVKTKAKHEAFQPITAQLAKRELHLKALARTSILPLHNGNILKREVLIRAETVNSFT